jgi:hypothetical protein
MEIAAYIAFSSPVKYRELFPRQRQGNNSVHRLIEKSYIYDAWAYKQAQLESSGADLMTCDATDNSKSQINQPVWDLAMQRWCSHVLSAIAITGMHSLNLSFGQTAEAMQYPELSVYKTPWSENVYLCNTSYVLTLLAQQGFADGGLDGVYSRQTKREVIASQKSLGNLVIDIIPRAKAPASLRNAAKDSFLILLKQRGFYQGAIDSQQGKFTTEVIWKAQRDYGLPLDRFASPLKNRALLAGGTWEIQSLLQKSIFCEGEINGKYDLCTRNNIVDAQNAYGQKTTGDISPELVAALNRQTFEATSNMQSSQNAQITPIATSTNDIRPSPNVRSRKDFQTPTSSQNLPTPTSHNTNSS